MELQAELQALIERLAYCRGIETEYRREIAELEAELAETPAGKRLAKARELLATARADVADSEAVLRIFQKRALSTLFSSKKANPYKIIFNFFI